MTDTKNTNLACTDDRTTADRVLKTCEAINIELPDNVHELQNWLIDGENHVAMAQARLGFGWIVLRNKIVDGEFSAFIESNGFSRPRVYEQIRIAEMLMNAPEHLQPKLIGVRSKEKLIALASLPTETIEELINDGNGADINATTVREMKQRIRDLEVAKAEAAIKLQDKDTELEMERKKRAAALPHTEFPDFYIESRHESGALSEQAVITMDSLNTLIAEHEKRLHESAGIKDGEEAQRYALLAAKTLYHHIRGVAAHAANLLVQMRDWDLEFMESITADLFLTDDEIDRFISNRDLLLQRHQHEQRVRNAERERNKPKGRGRPRKEDV